MKQPPSLTVFVDTSFILTMIKHHRTFDEEIRNVLAGPVRIAIPDGVVMELQRLTRRGKFGARALAKIALGILERKEIDTIESRSGIRDIDTAILALALAERNPTAVATVDRNMRDLLSKHGMMAVIPRSRTGLMVS